jgi:transcriptional regulator GlxA family with amidase domain
MDRREFVQSLGWFMVGARGAALAPPQKGKIPVAFGVWNGAVVLDFTGPYEVFAETHVPNRGPAHEEQMPFECFTVSDTLQPVTAAGGLQILPRYTYDTAPQPKIVVLPGGGGGQGRNPKLLEWVRKVSVGTDVTLSVCTGAFILADAGLLDGKAATTHDQSLDRLADAFPSVTVKRGVRFVDSGKVATAAGISAGIDLALRIVERYCGRQVASSTAKYMEYESTRWSQ